MKKYRITILDGENNTLAEKIIEANNSTEAFEKADRMPEADSRCRWISVVEIPDGPANFGIITNMKNINCTGKEQDVLEQIYANLQKNEIYGYMYTNCRYPFFDAVLYKTPDNYIGWHNYGSSANGNTLEELEWVLKNIFHCTPSEFTEKYQIKEKR